MILSRDKKVHMNMEISLIKVTTFEYTEKIPQVTFLCGIYVMILTTIFCNLAISNQKTATSD